MIILLLLLGYLFFVVGNPLTIYSVNRTQEKAMLAYNSADFVGSGRFYRHITDTLNFHTPDLYLAQGHAFFSGIQDKKDVIGPAQAAYGSVLGSTSLSGTRNSVALNQSALLSLMQAQADLMGQGRAQDTEALKSLENATDNALQQLKDALRLDGANEAARYNYQLLLQQKQQRQQNGGQEDQEGEEGQEGQEGQEGEEGQEGQEGKTNDQTSKTQQPPKQGQVKLSSADAHRAQQILEKMQKRQAHYFQQLRRQATKPKPRSKPDW